MLYAGCHIIKFTVVTKILIINITKRLFKLWCSDLENEHAQRNSFPLLWSKKKGNQTRADLESSFENMQQINGRLHKIGDRFSFSEVVIGVYFPLPEKRWNATTIQVLVVDNRNKSVKGFVLMIVCNGKQLSPCSIYHVGHHVGRKQQQLRIRQ